MVGYACKVRGYDKDWSTLETLIMNAARFTCRGSELMNLVEESRAVFSGSLVLRFVRGGDAVHDWEAADLDVYAPYETQGRRIVEFFQAEGYVGKVHPSGDGFDRPYANETGIACVVTLKKGENSVDVIYSIGYSPLLPIAHFYATHVMNVVTSQSVAVAYPLSTVAGRGYLRSCAAQTEKYRLAIEKYKERRFELVSFAENVETQSSEATARWYCPHKTRSFVDDGSIRLTFNDSASEERKAEDDALLGSVRWRWGGRICRCCDAITGQKIKMEKKSGKPDEPCVPSEIARLTSGFGSRGDSCDPAQKDWFVIEQGVEHREGQEGFIKTTTGVGRSNYNTYHGELRHRNISNPSRDPS